MFRVRVQVHVVNGTVQDHERVHELGEVVLREVRVLDIRNLQEAIVREVLCGNGDLCQEHANERVREEAIVRDVICGNHDICEDGRVRDTRELQRDRMRVLVDMLVPLILGLVACRDEHVLHLFDHRQLFEIHL